MGESVPELEQQQTQSVPPRSSKGKKVLPRTTLEDEVAIGLKVKQEECTQTIIFG